MSLSIPQAQENFLDKTFLFFIADYSGHLNAVSGVARSLVAVGAKVIFLTFGDKTPIESLGYEAVKINCSDEPLLVGLSRNQKKLVIEQWLESLDAELFHICKSLKPSMVMFDPFLLMFYPFFWRLKIKCVSFSSKPLLTADPYVPPYTSNLIPSKNISSDIKIFFNWVGQKLIYSAYRTTCIVNEILYGESHRSSLIWISKKNNFPLKKEWRTRPCRFDLSFVSVPELILHAKEFDFPRKNSYPKNVFYIGPCVDINRMKGVFTLPDGSGPLIYCHLGTVSKQFDSSKYELYKNIISVVSSHKSWRLVVATSNPKITNNLQKFNGSDNPRILISNNVQQMDVLSSSQLLISHGGGSSIKEAIICGVPTLAFPKHADQPGTVARLIFHGLGERIKDIDETSLYEAVEKILNNPQYKNRVMDMKTVYEGYKEKNVATSVIEKILLR
jgi:UDP:flavonoid glycosyltransferase YjiC (YdhE family)